MKKSLSILSILLGTAASAQVEVNASSGIENETYTTVKGAFDAINAGTHKGVINITITANTSENATAVLNRSNGSSNFTSLVLKPATGVTPTITNAATAGAVLRILGSNVTIDGSNNGTDTRDLTFVNTFETGNQVIAMGSSDVVNPLTNVTIKNTNVINSLKTSGYGIIVSNTAGAATAGYFNNIKLENNSIQKSYYGIYLFAVSSAGNGAESAINNNDLATSGTNSNQSLGVYVVGTDGVSVSNNKIGNFENTIAENKRGIWIGVNAMNTTVSDNIIDNIGYQGTGAGSATGIQIFTGAGAGNVPSANKILRNQISNLYTSGLTNSSVVGISLGGSTISTVISNNIVHDIVNTANGSTAYGAEGVILGASTSISNTLFYNNFIYKVSSFAPNTGSRVYTGGVMINGYGGGYKVYNNTVYLADNQTDGTNKGIPIAFSVRDLFSAGTVDARNNIFVTDQLDASVPTFAIHTNSNVNVFSALDNNIYYSSKDIANSSTFSNSTNYASFEDFKTYFGKNISSLKALPAFVSATDLHVSQTSENNAIDNKGVVIADVAFDIDNETRSITTPDIGADEFTVATMAVGNVVNRSKIQVYPNPVNDILTINADKKVDQISVYNVWGKMIQQINGSHFIDLSRLSSGVYFVKIVVEGQPEMKKVIKK